MEQHKILLVEDDCEISEMVKNYLAAENYEIICAFDGEEACRQFDAAAFSLVLLDLMIPKVSGMDVMQYIRKKSYVPVIILSAKDTETDKTLGLALGADDYITKPFSVVELLARIRANIRRTTQYGSPDGVSAFPVLSSEKSAVSEEIITVGELAMNLNDYTLSKNGKPVELTAKEFEILRLTNLVSDGRMSISTGQRMFNMLIPSIAFIVAAYIIHYGVHLQDEVDHTL